jgi:hypothetical protein
LIAKLKTVIADAEARADSAKAVYEEAAAKRATALATFKPLLEMRVEDEAEEHMHAAKDRCQPRLLCTQVCRKRKL